MRTRTIRSVPDDGTNDVVLADDGSWLNADVWADARVGEQIVYWTPPDSSSRVAPLKVGELAGPSATDPAGATELDLVKGVWSAGDGRHVIAYQAPSGGGEGLVSCELPRLDCTYLGYAFPDWTVLGVVAPSIFED